MTVRSIPANGHGTHRRPRALCAPMAVAIILATSLSASAQWRVQEFQLTAGWNSIFVEVDPQPAQANELFAGSPITSVWMRVEEPLAALVEACDGPNDTDCTPSTDTQWRVWLPPGGAATAVTSLRAIVGGRVYLIHASGPTTLTLVGRPPGELFRRWVPGFNLAGFYVVDDPGATPTFQSFLAPVHAFDNTEVFAVQPGGTVSSVAKTSRITPGLGYFVSSAGDVDYDGPLSIDLSTLRGVDFAKRMVTHNIELKNLATSARNVAVEYVPSAAVPPQPATLPTKAGDVPVHYLDYGQGSKLENMLQWHDLTSLSLPIAPDNAQTSPTTLRIGVQRTGLAGAVLDENLEGANYQGLLRLSDGAGFRRYVSVAAEVFPSAGQASAAAGGMAARPGLYLGSVKVDHVSWVTAGARVFTNDNPTAPEFAGLMRCFGGANDGDVCFPDRKRCVGNPEIELQAIACNDQSDCPEGTCEIVTDCPSGACNAYCIGGGHEGDACGKAVDCAGGGGDGVCSADLDNDIVRPTPYPFEFPVLIHLSDDGQYTMLTEISLLATEDRRLVLATPDCAPAVCDGLSGALTVNGEPFARRVSTAAFSFEHDLAFDGGGGFSTVLAGSTVVAGDDPLSPFKHTFHPDHDCVDADGNPSPGECYTVSRSFVFAFESEPPNGTSVLDWGDSELGGIYTEQVSGLHREPISAQGRFELRRVSNISKLNTPVGMGVTQ